MTEKETWPHWIRSALITPADIGGSGPDSDWHLDGSKLSSDTIKIEINSDNRRGFLLVLLDDDGTGIDFVAVEEMGTSYSSDSAELIEYGLMFHGWGTGGCLKECRHTYFGAEGYLFYMNGPLLIAAIKALERYFEWQG